MRKLLMPALAGVCLVFLAGPVRAQDDLKAVIVKAVKAHGGEDKLSKVKGVEVKAKGTIHLLGGLEYTSESWAMEPDKVKEVTSFQVMGQNVTQTVVINGDQMWINVNGKNIDLDDKIKEAGKQQGYERDVMSLLPLVKDKAKKYEYSALGESKVEGKDAIGIRVSSKGQKDVNLFFDKGTGLLVKVESRAVDFMTMQEVTQEIILLDYHDLDGYKSPKKVVINRDGKKFLDKEVTDAKLVDKIDDSVFAMP